MRKRMIAYAPRLNTARGHGDARHHRHHYRRWRRQDVDSDSERLAAAYFPITERHGATMTAMRMTMTTSMMTRRRVLPFIECDVRSVSLFIPFRTTVRRSPFRFCLVHLSRIRNCHAAAGERAATRPTLT